MAESLVQVTEGTGKKLHTNSRTIGANTVEDEYVLPGEYPLASYFIEANATSTATAASHNLQIMAGASLNVRIRRIRIEQHNNATTAAIDRFDIMRLTTAGTGGTAITPRPHDPSDAAAGCTAMTLPTVKGTEGVSLMLMSMALRQTVATAGAQFDDAWEWTQLPGTKPIIIPAGTTNGIVIKNISAVAGADINVMVELVETSFAG